MKLSGAQIKKVAKLANLPISSEEEEKYSEQLSDILDYVEQLNKVVTSDVFPTYNVTGNTNITQNDEPSNTFTQDETLATASKKSEGFFVTRGVFEE